MTVSTTTNKTDNFAAGVATMPFTFPVFDQDDLDVILVDDTTLAETLLTRGTDYTVALLYSGAGGGTITLDITLYPSGIPTGYSGYTKRVMAETQAVDLTNQGDWFPAQHEEVFDRCVMLIQQLQEVLDRALLADNGRVAWDAESMQMHNLADGSPSESVFGGHDAANVNQVVSISGSAATAAADAALSTALGYTDAALLEAKAYTDDAADAAAAATAAVANSASAATAAALVEAKAYTDAAVAAVVPVNYAVLQGSLVQPSNSATVTFPDVFTFGLLIVGGIPQAAVKDYTHTIGATTVEFLDTDGVTPKVIPAGTVISYLLFGQPPSVPGDYVVTQGYMAQLSTSPIVTFPITFKFAMITIGGVVQSPTLDYTHTVGTDTAAFLASVGVPKDIPAGTIVSYLLFNQ